MRWSTAAGVGVVVVVAVAILIAAFVLLESAGVIGNTYPLLVEFDNAQGITKGAEVRMAGVKIGEVEEVGLSSGNRARVKLRILSRYTVPQDAQIRLASSSLFGAPIVEIIPSRQGPVAKGVRRGTTPPTLDQLLPEAERLLVSMNDLTRSLQGFVGDPKLRRDLQRSTANLAEASERGKVIAENFLAASASGRQIASRFQLTTDRLDRTAALLQQTVDENRGKLGDTLTSVNDTLGAMKGLVEELTTVVADPTVRGSLRGSAANVEKTTANLEKISANLQALSGDPKLNEDLRATVSGLRVSVEESQRLLKRLNQIVGSGSKTAEETRERSRGAGVSVDLAQQSNPGQLRLDVNGYWPAGPERFYRFGLYDVTESPKLNLQLGQPLGRRSSIRYGMYASDLGVGLDVGHPARPRLSADLWGLNEPQLDLLGRARLGQSLDLSLGVQAVFKRNAPFVGVTWRNK